MKGHTKVLDIPCNVIIHSPQRIVGREEPAARAALEKSGLTTIEIVLAGELADELPDGFRLQIWRKK